MGHALVVNPLFFIKLTYPIVLLERITRTNHYPFFEHARGVEDEDLVAERSSLVMGPRSGEADSDPA